VFASCECVQYVNLVIALVVLQVRPAVHSDGQAGRQPGPTPDAPSHGPTQRRLLPPG
jgi:hypothetical protein